VKRKYERSQKIEQMGNTDEVLLEEIREYKVAFDNLVLLHIYTTTAPFQNSSEDVLC